MGEVPDSGAASVSGLISVSALASVSVLPLHLLWGWVLRLTWLSRSHLQLL